MSNADYQLITRLERAEYLIRADIASTRLLALQLEDNIEQLSAQAEILSNARMQLWSDSSSTSHAE